MKDLTSNPLALDAFRARCAAGDIEGAVMWARDNGYAVAPGLIPTPALTNVERLRREGAFSAADLAETLHAVQLGKERRAVAMATELAAAARGRDGPSPLLGKTTAEKVEIIMRRQAGLTHVDSVQALLDMDEGVWADQYRQANLFGYSREVEAIRVADARATSWAAHQQDLENARRRIAARYTTATGQLLDTGAYRAELAEVEREYDGRWLAFEKDAQAQAARFAATDCRFLP